MKVIRPYAGKRFDGDNRVNKVNSVNKVKLKTVALDATPLHSKQQLLAALKDAFLYAPEYQGKNLDACIDILSSMRLDDGMTALRLDADEAIALHVTHFDTAPQSVKDTLTLIISAVNEVTQEMGQPPLIYLLLVS